MQGYPLFTNTIHSTLTRRFGESLRYSCKALSTMTEQAASVFFGADSVSD
ncbi:hypothetical protein CPL00345_CDS0081 [Klebsiella phage GlastoCabaret]